MLNCLCWNVDVELDASKDAKWGLYSDWTIFLASIQGEDKLSGRPFEPKGPR